MKWLLNQFIKLKENLLFVLLVAFPLCLINAFIFEIRANNVGPFFLQNWMEAFTFNFLITYPLALLIVPIAKRIMKLII